jgi:hypothetical protein
MALNVGRWIRYAQARLARTTDDANAELDRLEAERDVELAERPWLSADAEAPTLDEARARIEWEARHQQEVAEGKVPATDGGPAAPDAPASPAPSGAADRPTGAAPSSPPAPGPAPASAPAPAPPTAEEAELAAARIEIDRRAAASKERLAQIREELGIEPPEGPPPSDAPPDAGPGPAAP